MFWQGDGGYYINIKTINLLTGEYRYHNNLYDTNVTNIILDEKTTKKVSAMNFYPRCLIVQQNISNSLLQFRWLFQQFLYMFAKIEAESLLFIRLNQTKLRTEEYVHLRDAIFTEGNAGDIGQLTILPTKFVRSPRHMHERA